MKFCSTSLFSTICFLLYLSPLFAQNINETQYFVELRYGKKVDGKEVRYVTPPFRQAYLLVNDSLKLPIDQVKGFQNQSGYFLKGKILSNGNEGFARRVLDGEVSLYQKTNLTYTAVPVGPYGAQIPTSSSNTAHFFTKGHGSLINLNYRNLQNALRNAVAPQESLKKAKNLGVTQNISYGLGAACILHGLVAFANQDTKEVGQGPNFPPTLVAAPVFFLVPLALQEAKKKHLREAIMIYNQNY